MSEFNTHASIEADGVLVPFAQRIERVGVPARSAVARFLPSPCSVTWSHAQWLFLFLISPWEDLSAFLMTDVSSACLRLVVNRDPRRAWNDYQSS